jgi:hypothetical protein
VSAEKADQEEERRRSAIRALRLMRDRPEACGQLSPGDCRYISEKLLRVLQREEKGRGRPGFRGLGQLVQALINGAPEVKNGRPVSGDEKREYAIKRAVRMSGLQRATVVRRYNEFLKSGEQVTIRLPDARYIP